MNRSIGVTIAAVVVLIGSVLTALIGMAMLFTLATPPAAQAAAPSPIPLKTLSLVMFGFWMLFAGLGFATAIGLFRLWRWARFSMIIFGCFLIFVALFAGVVVIALPMPPAPPAPDAAEFANIVRIVKIGMAVFYGLLALLGAWFIYLFTRKSVAEQFKRDIAAPMLPVRPVSITIVAWLMLLGLLSLPMLFVMQLPIFVFGMLLRDTAGRLIYIVWIGLFATGGIALLRLKRWGWPLAFGSYVLAVLNQAALLVPDHMRIFTDTMNQYSAKYATSTAPQPFMTSPYYSFVIGCFAVAVPIVLLLVGRRRYIELCHTRDLHPRAVLEM